MASKSRWSVLGHVLDTNDDSVQVSRDHTGWVRLTGYDSALEFAPDELAKLLELLGRAAMPGQVPVTGCVRLNCSHPQARHDGSRPNSPCEDCGCQGWTPPATGGGR